MSKVSIFIWGFFGGTIIWEFSVCGVNVLAPLSGSAPYGTYIPAYGGGGGGGCR